jgi:hypothetical protein
MTSHTMTSHTGRLYSLALAVVVFFLAWAAVAAHPWGAPPSDKRLTALAAREARLKQEAKLVHHLVQQRWATYRAQLKVRRTQIAAQPSAPAVRVVTLPPLTITRTS